MATPSPLARRQSAPIHPPGKRPLAVSTTRRPSGGPAAAPNGHGHGVTSAGLIMSPVSLDSPAAAGARGSPPAHGGQRPSPPHAPANGRGTPRAGAVAARPSPAGKPPLKTPTRPPMPANRNPSRPSPPIPGQHPATYTPQIHVQPSTSPPQSEGTHTPAKQGRQNSGGQLSSPNFGPSPSTNGGYSASVGLGPGQEGTYSITPSSPAQSFWATTEDVQSDDDLITEVDEHAPDEEFIRSLQSVGTLHTKQLRQLKRLLEQSQTGAASQLHALQAEGRLMRQELGREREMRDRAERALERERARRAGAAGAGASQAAAGAAGGSVVDMTLVIRGSLEGTISDGEVKAALRTLRPAERMRLIHIILDSCLPGDISAMIRLLDKYLKSTFDVLGNLPQELAVQVLTHLSVSELLGVETVSRTWQVLVHHPAVWRVNCLRIAANDPVPLRPPVTPEGWEPLYRGLSHRESNFQHGLPQTLRFLPGHTGYVTTLHLRGKRLISGSYDETVRVWDLETGTQEKELKVKAVSCAEVLTEEEVFAVGFHDVGRVQIFSSLTWAVLQTLQGHLYGIRALTMNSTYLVSAGADKALVCWDWRAGTKIVRFGQQTNLNIGVQLLGEDRVVGVTVDGVVRTFSIPKREMLSQFKLSDLLGVDPLADHRLAGVGAGQNTLQWFAAKGRHITCATKSLILRLEWPEESSDSARTVPPNGLPSPLTADRRAAVAHRRVSGPLGASGAATPVRAESLRRSSLGRVSQASVASSPKSTAFSEPVPLGKLPRVVSITETPDISVGAVDALKGRVVTSTRFSTRTGADRRIFVSTCRATQSGPSSSPRQQLDIVDEDGEAGSPPDTPRTILPRSGPGSGSGMGQGTEIVPITGVWAAYDELATPEKNPMSMALDHEEAVVGCADGTIYVLGFVGDRFTRLRSPDMEEE